MLFYEMFTWYKRNNGNNMQDIYEEIEYTRNDIFKLLFDFIENKVRVYLNDKEMNHQDLKADKLWIGLGLITLMQKATIIEMVDYKYD